MAILKRGEWGVMDMTKLGIVGRTDIDEKEVAKMTILQFEFEYCESE
jgi:hypothetical protein